ncbi:MAG: MFS transporter [Anaerolineae bacterium]|jgi:MFS family permease|nr:MFS transporter [Anaerolineae bacterium]MDX9832972.1 MFS transporter [Anaerolineae bacterium]
MNNHKTGMLTVLQNRDFLALWLSQLVSKVGDNFAVIAALVLINRLAERAGIAVVVIAAAMTIPQLFALASGVIVDRFSRKTVMILTDVLRAGVILLALLVQKPGHLYILYITAFGVMALGALYIPARNASIPNMVPEEHLLTANALVQATELASLIVGAFLASLIISLTSVYTAFIVDSVTFFISGVLLIWARIPNARRTTPTAPRGEFHQFWEEFTEGLRYIGSNKHLLQLMAITTVATLGLSATTLLAAAYFEQLLGISAQYQGFLLGTEGIGMALGALLISIYASWARSRQIVSVTMIVLGGGILVFAMAPVYWLVLIGALLVGLCVVSARTTLAAMTQALVSDAQRGRVESAMVTVIGIGTMGALIMAGVLGDIVGPKSVFMLTGVVVLLAGIASIFTLRGAEERLLNNLEP